MANIILTRSNLREEVAAALERSKAMPAKKARKTVKPVTKTADTKPRYKAVEYTRKWLYCKDGTAKIIETAKEYDEFVKAGWRDRPFK